jgi:ASC-1-like (ASCH) protein
MMRHIMRLFPEPFAKMQSGQKTIELRLNDEKRQQIRVGDEILFCHMEDAAQTLLTRVIRLYHFQTFDALYRSLPLLQCGYTEETLHEASPRDMDGYYPPEKQQRYGVLGIEVERDIE